MHFRLDVKSFTLVILNIETGNDCNEGNNPSIGHVLSSSGEESIITTSRFVHIDIGDQY